MSVEKLPREEWIERIAKILRCKPYKWSKATARDYAESLTEMGYDVDDSDYMDPEDALAEDQECWER